MANSNATISIGFKIEDGPDGFKQMIVNAKSLKQVLGSTVKEAEALRKPFINFAALAIGLDSVSSTISSLQSNIKDLSNAYATQIEVDTQLATNMRNTMDAREEDIQSIKDLCSAQQALGVIGDEVQLAGAQELATYLSQKDSLERLIPVMNDMLAQQYGLAASQENASQIATMLGKVMDGQVGALRRYGYSFDEAQEEVLKFGEESERAAILVDVITSSVGGMNEALAQTSVGRLKQLENTLGDIKEQIGQYATAIAPLVTLGANFTTLAMGAVKVTTGVKAAGASFMSLTAPMRAVEVDGKRVLLALQRVGISGRATAPIMTALGFSFKGAAVNAKAFNLALRSILVSSGVGAVIWAISAAISYFTSTSDDATESVEKLDDATDNYTQAAAAAKVQIDRDVNALGDLIKAKKNTTEAILRLNETYGELFGTHKTAEEWYKILTEKSDLYIKQIGYEAQARALAAKIAETAINKELAAEKKADWERANKDKMRRGRKDIVTGTTEFFSTDDEWKLLDSNLKKIEADGAELEHTLDVVNKKMGEVSTEMIRGLSESNTELKVSAMNLRQVESAISETEKALKDTLDDNEIARLRTYNAELKKRKSYLEVKTGLSKPTQKEVKPEAKAPVLAPKMIEEINALIGAQTAIVGDYVGGITKAKAAFVDLGVQWHEQPGNLREINDNLSILQARLENASPGDAAWINQQMAALNELVDSYHNAGVAAVDASSYVSEVGSVMQSLSSVLGDAGAGWLSWSANVCQAVSQALPALTALISALQAKAAGEAMSENAAAGPFGWIAGIAAMGGILAAFATLPKFANGGIISGPTVGLMGEYPGASNNPEVVAPLDKLQDLIAPANNLGGTVTFRIDGRTLVGILNKENSFSSRRR